MAPANKPVRELIPGINARGLIKKPGEAYETPEGFHRDIFERICYSGMDFGATPYMFRKQLAKALRYFKGETVVDLGAGAQPWIYRLADYANAKNYVAVEPNFPEAFVYNVKKPYAKLSHLMAPLIKPHALRGTDWACVAEDMLSFLRRLPDDSCSFFASGLELINDRQYMNAVADEMKRALSRSGAYLGYEAAGHVDLHGYDAIENVMTLKSHPHDSAIQVFRKKS